MTIPKEPRQAMINIMYLVLTALLALNVSAEIFNAFRVVDKGLKISNMAIDRNINTLVQTIKKNAEKDPEAYQKYVDQIPEVKAITSDLINYIDQLKSEMIELSGGYIMKDGKKALKGYKNKNVTSRFLVIEGRGEELKEKILGTRNELISMVPDSMQADIAKKLTLRIDDQTWREAEGEKKSWSGFMFRRMPLQAVLPMLTKFKNDAKSSEAVILNKYLEIIGGTEIVFDNYKVVSSPEKSYIILGETFKTDVFMTATTSTTEGLEIFVNGRSLPIKDGVATYTARPTSTGVNSYTAMVKVTNPVTGEVTQAKETYKYEVGRRSVSVSADKMNVMYIGVENPLTIAAAGVSSNALNVSGAGSGINITHNSGSSYTATVTTPGKTKVVVSGGGLPSTPTVFRVKRIPDPVPMIGGKSGGVFQTGAFSAQQGIYAKLIDFDFDARCKIVSYNVVYIPRGGDPIPVAVNGGAFNADAKGIINKASPGDRYAFEEIKTRCPGDNVSRKLPSFIVRIK